ncbi:type II secretion system major pseudopilin GspG [Novosphingopyxis baekryungensis]|uniref:type II secretion system major pseudopilin GspG n=1 Tax=Novosphingopyxis baekryungensis TaxID=279369 RepID=UPI0003B61B19|nr:type II secretion system major pseudopilin GspG [Novosphingopyxis baekryungensis]
MFPTLQRCLRVLTARHRRAKSPESNGFTLVELMVVIFIIGLLATVVIINVLPSQDRAMTTKAQADISILGQALEQYRLDNLTYPSGSDGLNALVSAPAGLAQPARYRRGGYIQRLPDDPWGRPYQYQNPGPDGGPAVFSLGADGAPGGEDENADIYQQ